MRNLVIIGAGGFGREVVGLVDRINLKEPTWNIKGFLDDNMQLNMVVNGYKVLGGIDTITEIKDTWVVCSIGDCRLRKKIVENLKNKGTKFATLLDPSAILFSDVEIGEGSIICAGSILTVNINIGTHVIINIDTTIGHDCNIGDYCTISPGTNLSGHVHLGECVDIGTGSKIIQGKHICNNVILGAGSVAVKDIFLSGTYVGCPTRKIK